MDKRTYLGTLPCRKDGKEVLASLYRKSNNRGLSCRINYGSLELYVSSYATKKMAAELAEKAMALHPDRIVDRPFYKPGVYIYVLGKKRYFTEDKSLNGNDTFFYLPPNTKDPLTRYKKEWLANLTPRVIEIGRRMGVDLSGWKIRTGLFLSYFAVCFPTKHQLKFDYRLFAYRPEISDSVIIHEIAHTYDIHHDERFYTIVKTYCPNLDELNEEINAGWFEGRIDHNVL